MPDVVMKSCRQAKCKKKATGRIIDVLMILPVAFVVY